MFSNYFTDNYFLNNWWVLYGYRNLIPIKVSMDLMEVDVVLNNLEFQVEKQDFILYNIENDSDLLVEVQPNDFIIIRGCLNV